MTMFAHRAKRILRDSPLGIAVHETYAYALPYIQRLKGSARSSASDVITKFGLPSQVQEPLSGQWARIVRRSGLVLDRLPSPSGPRVLIASGYGSSETKLAVESILSVGLRLRGAAPTVLLCDKALAASEFNRYGNYQPSPGKYGPRLGPHGQLLACRLCTQPITDVFRTLALPRTRLSAYSRSDDLGRLSELIDEVPCEDYRSYRYKDIAVGEHAFSSVLRATLRGTLLDDEYTRWLFRRYLLSAMHLVDLTERLIANEQPERVVATHGVYVTHGTICEVARKHGIPVVVFGIPYRRGTIWLSHGDTYHRTLVTEPTTAWEDQVLTSEQEHQLDMYLDSKRGGGRDYVNYHPNPVEDARKILEDLALDSALPVISLYTNVLWDAQIYYTYNAFANMLEWIFATIEHFSGRSDVQLVIRIHPAEVKGGLPTAQPILPEITARYPELPTNVRLVPPESDVSSYSLAEMSKAALIYGTKMGLEIAIRGVPVIVAGETFNRGKGFTYDVSSAEEYFALLDRVATLPRNTPAMIARARRYAYYLFFRRMIDFPLFSVEDAHSSAGLRLCFRSVSDLAPGRDRALDIICEGILTGSPFSYGGDESWRC
jgi:hypothetical protein